jgi:DNA-binding MarR family transcriptional regulator
MRNSESDKRNKLVRDLFENIGIMKRGMYSHLQAANSMLPISRSQLEVLVAIHHNQLVNFKELARQLYLTPGAVSQLAEVLEQEGYISRQIDAKDRRIQCLQISKKGAKLLQDVDKRRRKIIQAVLEDLTDEELELWVRVQKKLVTQFQSEVTSSENKEVK